MAAPSRSPTSPAVTRTRSSRPRVSTSRWRLRPLTFLAPSKPCQPPIGDSDALAVQDPGAGGRITALADALVFAQHGQDLFPQPVAAPEAKVVVDGLPGRQVMGQQAPGAAAAHPIRDGVEQLAAGVAGGAAAGSDRWDERLEQSPLGIRQVSRVGPTRA